MKTVWNDFWEKKGKNVEWKPEDVLNSKAMEEIAYKILSHLSKKRLKDISLLEIGSGIGITSLFFGYKGANVTLLDKSREVKNLAKEYWSNYASHRFIIEDLFNFKTKNKYDLVTSFGLCEHFIGKQRKEVLEKHIQFLKNKGVAIISVPYKYGVFYRVAKKLAEIFGFWDFGLEIPFDKKELIEFAKSKDLNYEIIMGGFYSSAYDLFIRKPLKVLKISTKRRFDNAKSIFDNYLGSGLMIILKNSI
jgi:2-polyprenyl-3-methyl-5-hydroxy-6-metoxy-1,4-benzoquinol methylase